MWPYLPPDINYDTHICYPLRNKDADFYVVLCQNQPITRENAERNQRCTNIVWLVYGQNGDKPKRRQVKTATSQNGDKSKRRHQNGNN